MGLDEDSQDNESHYLVCMTSNHPFLYLLPSIYCRAAIYLYLLECVILSHLDEMFYDYKCSLDFFFSHNICNQIDVEEL